MSECRLTSFCSQSTFPTSRLGRRSRRFCRHMRMGAPEGGGGGTGRRDHFLPRQNTSRNQSTTTSPPPLYTCATTVDAPRGDGARAACCTRTWQRRNKTVISYAAKPTNRSTYGTAAIVSLYTRRESPSRQQAREAHGNPESAFFLTLFRPRSGGSSPWQRASVGTSPCSRWCCPAAPRTRTTLPIGPGRTSKPASRQGHACPR